MKIVAVAMKLALGGAIHLAAPARHHDLFPLAKKSGYSRAEIANSEQGFLTDEGVFVGRERAFEIANAANQMIGQSHPHLLFSEDVW